MQSGRQSEPAARRCPSSHNFEFRVCAAAGGASSEGGRRRRSSMPLFSFSPTATMQTDGPSHSRVRLIRLKLIGPGPSALDLAHATIIYLFVDAQRASVKFINEDLHNPSTLTRDNPLAIIFFFLRN